MEGLEVNKGMAFIPGEILTRGTDPKETNELCLKNNDYCKEKWFKEEESIHFIKLDPVPRYLLSDSK